VWLSGQKWIKVGETNSTRVLLTVFRGIQALQLDDKGRMAIPARYREILRNQAAGQLILTIDPFESCLLLYSLPQWQILEQKLIALSSLDASTRRLQRLLIGHAAELMLDNQGRLLLPALLRQHATLEKQIILLGQGNKFELWSLEHWEEKRQIWLKPEPGILREAPPHLRELSL